MKRPSSSITPRTGTSKLIRIADDLSKDVESLRFSAPVTHVYNPLLYARDSYVAYLLKYATPPKEVVFLGMNPGPWGMVQTGIPFGEIRTVQDWLRIESHVGRPAKEHSGRPVVGMECRRSEVSGRRLWGWARETFGTPQGFFKRFFILNYCPLAFFDEAGRNRTPDHMPIKDRIALYVVCDRALKRTTEVLQPRHVIGIGRFAEERARKALEGTGIHVAGVPHPSPANPAANKNWVGLFVSALTGAGIRIR